MGLPDLPDSVLSRIDFYPIEDILAQVLNEDIPEIPTLITVEAKQEVPFILVRRTSSYGLWDGEERFFDVALVNVWVYTSDPDGDEKGALISSAARSILRDGAHNNREAERGWMRSFQTIDAPYRVPDWAPSTGPVQYADLPSGTWRYQAQYNIGVRYKTN